MLLFISALVSGSEVAFFSLNPADKDELKSRKTRSAGLVLKQIDSPQKLLATILVANNFVNVGIVILSSWITNSLLDFTGNHVLGFIFQVVVITALLLLFGEIIPKVYAAQHPKGFSLLMAGPLNVLEKIFRPVNTLLISSTSFVNRRFKKHKQNISIDDISEALELTSNEDLKQDKDILEGIIKFGNISVDEIMRSRVDVVALELKDDFMKALSVINESGFSRIPVYSESFDNVRGILYVKDLLPHIHKGKTFKWQSVIRPPFYVPETKKIDDLLEEFQKNKVHMAIVVDEYGGTSGIITLEDILEEIVGEISDEYDEDEKYYTKIDDKHYQFDGKILLNDFYKVLNCPDDIFDQIKGDADTLAGLILEIKGDIPEKNETITYGNFLFSIEAADDRRIKQIKVEIQS
ncbi:gliding motility-associated protein GldE [Puteibacter caeruleilacunae]|nr:gliding motility-associated protein GldE [Puteibacter caeruleilacunae]